MCVLTLQLGWAAASALKTEKFYDALGSTGFISVTIATLTYTHFYYARQVVVSVFVCLWALRLGSFLLFRVLKTGKDSRFTDVLDRPGETYEPLLENDAQKFGLPTDVGC